ncbi:MAG: holo-ACP synthase [Candidatus Nanopelagicales bacterium]
MLAVGTDIVRVSRFHDRGESFLRRCFTPGEIDLCAGQAQRLAGRWAAKEAVLKALGVGIGEVPLTDIEVLRADTGAPLLSLSGAALIAAGDLTRWHVSLSHDGDYAVAFVVATDQREAR